MQNAGIELFYNFFQGILTFQVLFTAVLYFLTRRNDLLFYCLFLFFAAVYFFINAPFTFLGIPEEVVWNSVWYDYINTPVIIGENFFYLLFLKAFFTGITRDRVIRKVFRITLMMIPLIVALFVVLTLLHLNKQFIFYTVKLITVIPSGLIAFVVLKKKLPFFSLVSLGLLCTIIGTCTTVLMIVLGNNGVPGLFTTSYPLFFIRLGILGDMVFYMAAIMRKWHIQEKQAAIDKVRAELAVEKVRNRISAELHDDLGATLSGISMYSYIADDYLNTGNFEKAKESLAIIQKTTKQVVSELGDLVWTVNPRHDSFETIFERLQQYGSEICAARRIKFTANCSKPLFSKIVQIDARRDIYLFLKEAINNAVKHSGASRVELSFTNNNGHIVFAVKDDGRGFDAASIKQGNGLSTMQARAVEIGGKLALSSDNSSGTFISLSVKSPDGVL